MDIDKVKTLAVELRDLLTAIETVGRDLVTSIHHETGRAQSQQQITAQVSDIVTQIGAAKDSANDLHAATTKPDQQQQATQPSGPDTNIIPFQVADQQES